MDDSALTPAERALLAALNRLGVRYLVIGLVPIRVLPLERVIASKRATNRPKDVGALPALQAALRARTGE